MPGTDGEGVQEVGGGEQTEDRGCAGVGEGGEVLGVRVFGDCDHVMKELISCCCLMWRGRSGRRREERGCSSTTHSKLTRTSW